MANGVRVVMESGSMDWETDTFDFENGILYVYDEDGSVLMAVPQENVKYVIPWNMGNEEADKPNSEPVCKREAFAGGGSPSPRECDLCGEGPCTKDEIVPGCNVVVLDCSHEQSWKLRRRTVIAKLESGHLVVSRVGEPIARLYRPDQLRLVRQNDDY